MHFLKADFESVFPVLSQILDSGGVLGLMKNPCINLSPRQMAKIEELAYLFNDREGMDATPFRKPLCRAIYSALFYEIANAFWQNSTKESVSVSRSDRIFLNFIMSVMKNVRYHRNVSNIIWASLR